MRSRAEDGRQHLGDLGLAHAGLAFEQQRAAQLESEEHDRRERAVGHVALLGHRRAQAIDGERGFGSRRRLGSGDGIADDGARDRDRTGGGFGHRHCQDATRRPTSRRSPPVTVAGRSRLFSVYWPRSVRVDAVPNVRRSRLSTRAMRSPAVAGLSAMLMVALAGMSTSASGHAPRLVKDIRPGPDASVPSNLAQVGDRSSSAPSTRPTGPSYGSRAARPTPPIWSGTSTTVMAMATRTTWRRWVGSSTSARSGP